MRNEFHEAAAAILKELGEEVDAKDESTHTPTDERTVAGFEEIQRFFHTTGELPSNHEGRPLLERTLAVRFDTMLRLEETKDMLAPLDYQGLLTRAAPKGSASKSMSRENIVATLEDGEKEGVNITRMVHARTYEEREAAEEIANRRPCKDFEKYKGMFKKVDAQIKSGVRRTMRFEKVADIEVGRFFILGGQMAYVDEVGETIHTRHRRNDARLRVIFDNGNESNMLLRSLQRALLKDEAGRRISEPNPGPLIGNWKEEGERPSATMYVLRSNSSNPTIAGMREFIHKIGVTTTDIRRRLGSAHLQPTYLMASVEHVANFELFDINHKKLESILHRVFSDARLSITVHDRFGKPIKPREWFNVPLHIIRDVVDRIRDGSIVNYVYDAKTFELVEVNESH